MSIHYNKPLTYTSCHVLNCINSASACKPLSYVNLHESEFDRISEDKFESLTSVTPIKVEVTWDSCKKKIFGQLVNSCSRSNIDYFYAEGIGYLYEVVVVKDYGDEGDIDSQGYITSPVDLVAKYAYLFDSVGKLDD